MRTIKLTISFDGTGYCGWQRQENGKTIQGELERAASLICNSPVIVHGAGRTDAGVHAVGMCAHFNTTSRVSCLKLQNGLNSLLSAAIRITAASDESSGFHARYSSQAKTYCYAVFTGFIQCPTQRLYTAHFPFTLSGESMQSCLDVIAGKHDFSSFETSGSRDKNLSRGRGAVRTIMHAELRHPEPELFHFLLTGDGFLRHMVRNLVGTIIEVGQDKQSIVDFKNILENKDRQGAGTTAPAHGLTLLGVHYNETTYTSPKTCSYMLENI